MGPVHGGLGRLASFAGWAGSAVADAVRTGLADVGSVACEIGRAADYVVRTVASPAGVRGVALEWAWLAAHVALYPAGAVREQFADPDAIYRTDSLPPLPRSLLVGAPDAAGTPIVLVHGILDNRSVFTVFRRVLRRRGFTTLHAVNYSLFTGDVRSAARELRAHIAQVRERTGAEKVHVVGHSLGGVIARYYVQRMGGDAVVDTLVTLGSPHSGTLMAYLMPTPLAAQLRPGSDLMSELDEPAPGCRTRFLVVWSRMDEMIVPQRNARLAHPDLHHEHYERSDVGHLSLPIDSRVVHWVAGSLARSDYWTHPSRAGQRHKVTAETDERRRDTPAS